MCTNVFCVFEGGGAKGVAHVGALRAIEFVEEFEVKGFAGTSAGAIVAALAAAGWSSDELVSQHPDGTVESQALQAIDKPDATSLADLFGGEWNKLQKLGGKHDSKALGAGWLEETRRKWTLTLLFLATWPIFYHVGRWLLEGSGGWLRIAAEAVAIGAWAMYGWRWWWVLRSLKTLWRDFRGVADMKPIVEVLDKLLEAKIKPEGERVTFKDLSEKGRDLKIVAANINTGSMKLFDAAGTPGIAVADAVAASACIPVAFTPVNIEKQQFCDGGIVSNLPAWTFDDERLLDDECLVVTCELLDVDTGQADSDENAELSGLKLLIQTARTAVFGGAALNTRGLQHHIRIPMEPDVGLLEFDRTGKHLKAIDDAEKIAELRIDAYRFEQESLVEIHEAAVAYLKAIGIPDFSLRTALAREVKLVDRPPAVYALWCSEGFSEYRDSRLLLPVRESLVGRSIERRCPCSLHLDDPSDHDFFHRLDRRPASIRLLPNDREWVVAVPLNRAPGGLDNVPPEHISVAVTIDCNAKLPGSFNDHLRELRNIVDNFGVFTPY